MELKNGDLLKYHNASSTLNVLGFRLGQLYTVSLIGNDLMVMAGPFPATIVRNGELTDYADNFSKHSCPVILPKGMQN